MPDPEEVGRRLRDIGLRPAPLSYLPEERAPDLSTASSSRAADQLAEIQLAAEETQGPPIFTHFLDGVQRTIMVGEIEVRIGGMGTFLVPIHGAHIVAGVMRIEGRHLAPVAVRQARILLMPIHALREAEPSRFQQYSPLLDPAVEDYLYPMLVLPEVVYSDTARAMERRGRTPLPADGLIRAGDIRNRAVNRSKVLLRILELGVLGEVAQEDEAFILADGPLGPVFKYYASIVSDDIVAVARMEQNETARREAFQLLRRVVGCVKNVLILPSAGLTAIQPPVGQRTPVFRFQDVLGSGDDANVDDDVYRAIWSLFVMLRPEMPGLWSPIGGLTRLDVPVPVVLSEDWGSRDWVTEYLSDTPPVPSSEEIDRLRNILLAYRGLRWPLPGAHGIRSFTELYAIAETERWLRGQLLHPFELRRAIIGG